MSKVNGTKHAAELRLLDEATRVGNGTAVRVAALSESPEQTRSAPEGQKAAVEAAVRTILDSVGEDPDREGLQRTPHRVAKMYDELLAGYSVDPVALINGALFDVEYDEMIVVKDIEYFSMCEHHMLPFYGRAHVAYIPSDKIVGLSKIPRIVEMFARRLQVQERMTRQIAELIDETLQPQGVAVVIEGSHMCSMMRGVKKEHPRMVTSTMLGSFKENPMTRNEFMQHLRHNSPNSLM
ncbi:MAG: GTP cyclohydrolase I FolE [Candidatus Promineifilaceae bacterium]|nr:GTP cyclohydrolase I FolE [Candidatus Promineifilaceae bacterium]